MKTLITSTIILLLMAPTAMAKSCQEKFIDLITNVYSNKGPTKNFITQAGKGVFVSKNYFYSDGKNHGMTEMIEPANMGWTLFYDNAGYTSSDKGKTWKKAYEYDAEKQAKSTKISLKKNAETARNIVCGEEDFQGVAHETIEGDYTSGPWQGEIHDKYWVNQSSGWVSKNVRQLKNKSADSITVQIIEPAPDLKLPIPK